MEKNLAAIIGWVIFAIILIYTGVTKKFQFLPFHFGCAYYVIYVFRIHNNVNNNPPGCEKLATRLMLISLMALYLIWSSLIDSGDKDAFIRSVKARCNPSAIHYYKLSESNLQLCDEIKLDIDHYLLGKHDQLDE